jgi:hypothetical protein
MYFGKKRDKAPTPVDMDPGRAGSHLVVKWQW